MFRVKFGCADAEEAMARELIELNKFVLKLETRIEKLENDRHRAFHREPPREYTPPPAPIRVKPIDDDDWIITGREKNNVG